jgi:DNA-binding transcriptional LysR family regulator
MNSVLPILLRTFHERYPDVSITLQSGQAMVQIDSLARRDIDIAFALLPLPREDILLEPVHEGSFVVIASDNLPFPDSVSPIPLARFRDFGFVATARAQSPGLDDMRTALFTEAGFTPRFVQYAGELPTMVTLAAAGIGILLVPEDSVPAHLPGIRRMRIATEHRARLYAAIKKDEPASVVVKNFWNLALELRQSAQWLSGQCIPGS